MNIKEFEAAHEYTAQLVALHGDVYLPAFLDAERRLNAAKQNTSAADRARAIAERANHV